MHVPRQSSSYVTVQLELHFQNVHIVTAATSIYFKLWSSICSPCNFLQCWFARSLDHQSSAVLGHCVILSSWKWFRALLFHSRVFVWSSICSPNVAIFLSVSLHILCIIISCIAAWSLCFFVKLEMGKDVVALLTDQNCLADWSL